MNKSDKEYIRVEPSAYSFYASRLVSKEDFENYIPSCDASATKRGPVMIDEENSDQDYGYIRLKEWSGKEITETLCYTNNDLRDRIENYFQLMNDRPELFEQSEHYPLVSDKLQMLKYESETKNKIGVIYGYGSKYYMLIVDLVQGKNGPYTYSRIVYTNKSSGSVIIPCFIQKDKEPLFGFLDIYRHPIRTGTGLEFPRGFAIKGNTPEQDALRELQEELCLSEGQEVYKLTSLGKVFPDGGLSNGNAEVFLAHISGKEPSLDGTQGEGIKFLKWLTKSQLIDAINKNEIADGFTLSSFLFFLTKNY